MDASYSDIQYKGVMKYGTGYHHVAAGKMESTSGSTGRIC